MAPRVFVVVDMRGAGRVLGVFERAAEATELPDAAARAALQRLEHASQTVLLRPAS